MGKLSVIIDGLVSLLGFAAKHPIVTKMLFFTVFVSIVTFALNFFFGLVRPYIVSNSALQIAYLFGVLQAVKLYISILISGFGVKQVIGFIKAT